MNSEIFILSKSAEEELKENGVAVIYFFGSRASRNYLSFSDIDVGIVLEEKRLAAGINNLLYNNIYDILASGIHDKFEYLKLDISFIQKSNPILAMKAVREGKIIYESNGKIRADFEETLIKEYDDYRMLQYEYEEASMRAFEKVLKYE